MSSRHLAGLVVLSFLVGLSSVPALADVQQVYTLEGSDTFRIAGRDLHSIMTYTGLETMSFRSVPHGTLFNVRVTYDKNDGTTIAHERAAYALTMSPDGEVTDQHDADPDYLTILNQPFSVQLDQPTMRDLHGLDQAVPFDFPSPMTGKPLHGTLRRLADGTLDGVRVLGIAFTAQGPLSGTLPDRPGMALGGTISMNGTAYYAYTSALLLALDATLLIEGKIAGPAGDDAVTITYKRVLRPAPAETRGR
jgi:hypothetical protein